MRRIVYTEIPGKWRGTLYHHVGKGYLVIEQQCSDTLTWEQDEVVALTTDDEREAMRQFLTMVDDVLGI